MKARLRIATPLLASLLVACSSGGSESNISLQSDRDGDGLPDRLEALLGSDPADRNDPFVDGHLDFNTPDGPGPDGIPDGLERYLLSQGAIAPITALSDRDGDQIPDYLEVAAGSDLTDRDDPVLGGAQDFENNSGPSQDGITDGLESFLLRRGASPPLTALSDSDLDGLGDVLEVRSGSNPFDDADPPFGRAYDLDLDGLPDWLEIQEGSDFLSANFPTFEGANDDDSTFGPDGDAISDGLEGWLVRQGATAPITTLTDSDGDGATDFIEIAAGSNPFSATSPIPSGAADSDGDGVPDSVELLFRTKLKRSISRTSDFDRDGITDYAELLSGSAADDAGSPTLFSHFDLDRDGIVDFLEIEHGSDPLDPDSPLAAGGQDLVDATGPGTDRISDGLEALLIQAGSSAPVTTYTDTDGDGVPDLVELLLVSDPFDANSPLISGALDVNDATGPAQDGISDAAELVLIRLGSLAPVIVGQNSDSDTLPDEIELILGSNPSDARSPFPNRNADIDRDGAADYLEIAKGTDFRSADDPVVSGGTDSDGDGLSDALEFLLAAGGSDLPVNPLTDSDADGLADYLEIRFASDPYDGDNPVSNGGADLEDRNGPAGDSISDAFEFYLIESGSARPALRSNDTDKDLVPDFVEARLGYDAFDPDLPLLDGGLDSDGDGVSNALELVLAQLGSTTPIDCLTDTDGDGAPDHLEIFAGTSPFSANEPILGGFRDVDADGLADALEKVLFLLGATDPVTPQSDTDRDGIPDGFEATLGTHPLNADHPLIGGAADVVDATGPADTITDGLESELILLGASAPITRATDTDGDGAPDHLEAFASASPLDSDNPVPGGAVDTDGDGMSQSLEEVLIRWGAQAPVGRTSDSDRDGAPDFLEVQVAAHPTNADVPIPRGATTGFDANSATGPAGDNISDALERIMIDLGCTPPITSFSDTDLDGLPDYFEGRFGTNPIDADSPVANGSLDSDNSTGPAGDDMSDGLEAFLIAGGATGPITQMTDTDGDGVPDFYEVFKGSNPFDGNDFIAPGTKPTATAVRITGVLFSGRQVSGSYTYADAEGDPEGVSTFRWLRAGTPIPGETSLSYTMQEADLGTNLSFEVTPVARFAFPPSTAVGDPSARAEAVPFPQFPSGADGPGGIDISNSAIAFRFRAGEGEELSVTNLATSWTDISGNGIVINALTPGRRPEAITSAVNGQPALTFASQDLMLLTQPMIGEPDRLLDQDLTLVATVLTSDTSTVAGTRGIISGADTMCTPDFLFGVNGYAPELGVGGTAATGATAINDGKAHHIISTRVQLTGRIRNFLDGLEDGTALGAVGPICSTTIYFGGEDRNGPFFSGEVFELFAFRRVLTPLEILLLQHYLQGRYGGTLANGRYAHFDTHGGDVTGVGRLSASEAIESAEGEGILRISNLESLDTGDFLFWGTNDADDFNLSTDVPAPYPQRLNRVWAYTITETTPGDGVGRVSMRFRVNGLFLQPVASAFALLLDDDENFADATVHTLGRSYSGLDGTISFTDVDLTGVNFFTLAVTPQ